MIRILSLAILLLGLSACGFQLRQALSLPADMAPVRVVAANPYSPLAESLSRAIESAGAKLAPENATTEVATLRILTEKWASIPVSIDQYGRAQEYSLRYAVVFSLDRADGVNLVPKQVVELARDYVSVPTSSTGTESERELLSREMQRDMSASIIRRIDAAMRAPMPAQTPAEPAAPTAPVEPATTP